MNGNLSVLEHNESSRLLSTNQEKGHNISRKILKYWSKKERKLWVVALFAATTVLFAARVAMPVCATRMAHEFGWSKEALGTVMGCFFWGYALTQIFGGYMADRFGGDKVLFIAAIVWGTLTFVTPYVTYISNDKFVTLLLLGFFRVLLGLSQGVHFPSMSSLLSHNIRESGRAFSMGVVSSGGNFGSLLCGGFGSIILENGSWQDVFRFIGAVALFGAFFLWTLSDSQQRKRVHKLSAGVKEQVEVPWKAILSKLPFWCASFEHFCNNATYFVWLMWLPNYYHETFPHAKGWVFNVIPWLVSIPASTFGGWLSDRIIRAKYSVTFSRKLIESIAMIGSGIFAVILPSCTNYHAALFVSGAAISCQTFHNSAVLVNPQDIAPDHAGSVFGIMNTAGAIPSFLGVYAAGYILERTGSWTIVFSCVCLTNIVGLLIFLIGGTGKQIV